MEGQGGRKTDRQRQAVRNEANEVAEDTEIHSHIFLAGEVGKVETNG